MELYRFILFLAFGILALIANIEAKGKTLVLVDNWSIKETHSTFFKYLKNGGYELTFRKADDSSLTLSKYGEYIYKNLVILAPSVKTFGGTLTIEALTEFVDAGNNVFAAASSAIGDSITEFASECGIEFDEESTNVIDHLNYDASDNGKHTTIVSGVENLMKSPVIVGTGHSAPFLFNGIGMTADAANTLVMKILTASSTAYSFSTESDVNDFPHAIGKETLLIAGIQARNNARVVFIGSIDFISDEYFTKSVQSQNPSSKKFNKSGNQKLVESIMKWVFKETGVLTLGVVKHHLVGEKYAPEYYTVRDKVEYSIEVNELNSEGKLVPFNGKDIQLEFVRIDPFIRIVLPKKGKVFQTVLELPDVYGIYKFRVDYKRIGYTNLYSSLQASVRPLEHTQYERFIDCAYPYYISSFSMMAGLCVFSFIFLHFKEPEKKVKAE